MASANTRFYFPAEGSAAPAFSPAFDAGWEQTGQATRMKLLYKFSLSTLSPIATTANKTVPITTTQDILCSQFVSDPIPSQLIDSGSNFALIVTGVESALTANIFLAAVVRIVNPDGTIRGTLTSAFSSDVEFGTTISTRRVFTANVTPVTTLPGDCIVVEIGGHAAAPTAATTFNLNLGNDNAADFAFTSSLTTNLNPFCSFSHDIFSVDNNNYKSVKSGNGISIGERIR